VRRCLINWDYGSSGIWLLPSKPNACQPSLEAVLSPALHEDLKRWNTWAERLFDGRSARSGMGGPKLCGDDVVSVWAGRRDDAVPARKALLQALVHEIRVEGRDSVVPWFRVPGGADPKFRALARSRTWPPRMRTSSP